MRIRIFFVIFLLLAGACSLDKSESINIFSFGFDFNESDHDWKYGFADYPSDPKDSTVFDLKSSYTNLPDGQKGFVLSANNHNDNLFMFLKKKLTGLQPLAEYTLTFTIQLSSDNKISGVNNLTADENVFLKVGATSVEPKSVETSGKFVMNIDKGYKSESGTDMVYIGNVAADTNSINYPLVNRNSSSASTSPLIVQTNANGELWLIVGTDSGFQGVTTLYYKQINIVLSAPR